MDSANVNIDILHLILQHSDQHAVSQIMKTCHLLNREGVQYLLRALPTISTPSQALSFLVFVLPSRKSADIGHRLRCIDCLHVMSFDDLEVEMVAKLLLPFFTLAAPHAPNFSFLEIDNAERFFAEVPELPAAVAELTTLNVLKLDDVGEKTVVMLRALQSSLTEVDVHFHLDSGIRPSAREDQDPISFLHRSEDTLRCISLRSSVSSPAAGCYRNVHMLSLSYIEMPTTRHFVRAFPNLECLRATEWKAHLEEDPEAAVERQRDLNLAEQARDASWRSLTSYEGSLLMLYMFALRCHVSHICVHDDDEEVLGPTLIRAILGDTSPLHLTIQVGGVEYFLMQAEEFVELSRSREFGRLPSLRLELTLWRSSWDADMEGLINLVFDFIAPSPVPAVTLIVNISSARTEPTHRSQPNGFRRPYNEPPKPSPVKLFLDTLDPDTVAERLFTGNPSRCAVKVIFIRSWEEERDVAHRGYQDLIIDHDFDKFF
uniref:Acyl-CoA ligase AKT1 ) n=1 Tax=Ganoderma boninense TaxID=34458 RepID=A0A5K1K7M4_9APHY|nr:Acyl-CoA ligase AKT1 (EC (AK-toxin biosynthesis protein 1) [Ganoderma boninense]